KVFQLKVGVDGSGILKEQAHKHISGEQTKIKVVFALDAEMRIVEPVLETETALVGVTSYYNANTNSLQEVLTRTMQKETPIYYPLNNLNYICEHNVILHRGKITRNTINLYIPITADNRRL